MNYDLSAPAVEIDDLVLPEIYDGYSLGADIKFSYALNNVHNPFVHLNRGWYETVLGTKEIFFFRMSDRIFDAAFEPDFRFLNNVAFTDNRKKTFLEFGMGKESAFMAKNNNDVVVVLTADDFFVGRKKDYKELVKLVAGLSWEVPPPRRKISVFDGISWDEHTSIFRRDFEFFIKSRGWFNKRGISYTRAYLLYGPPGNGKTTTIKKVAESINARIESYDFANSDANDKSFLNWLSRDDDGDGDDDVYLSLKVMEDLDRFFPSSGPPQTGVTLSGILNALDGARPHDSTIIIATANHPENLNSKVLARPGRFDRKILYSPPSIKKSQEYLTQLFRFDPEVSQSALQEASKIMETQSYATLKEVLKTSASLAFARMNNVDSTFELIIKDEDVLKSAKELISSQDEERQHLTHVTVEKLQDERDRDAAMQHATEVLRSRFACTN